MRALTKRLWRRPLSGTALELTDVIASQIWLRSLKSEDVVGARLSRSMTRFVSPCRPIVISSYA